MIYTQLILPPTPQLLAVHTLDFWQLSESVSLRVFWGLRAGLHLWDILRWLSATETAPETSSSQALLGSIRHVVILAILRPRS